MVIEQFVGKVTKEIMRLLLLADPDENMMNKYLSDSEIFIASEDNKILGVVAILHKDNSTSEIMNIAVDEKMQNKGIGKKLLKTAEDRAIKIGSELLEVGTGNCGFSQFYFYQSFGFRFHSIIKNFFADYKEEIYENGIRCIDMIRFRKDITGENL